MDWLLIDWLDILNIIIYTVASVIIGRSVQSMEVVKDIIDYDDDDRALDSEALIVIYGTPNGLVAT